MTILQNGIPPFNVPYSNNPVIINQVELATPLQSGYEPTIACVTYPNGTKTCQTLESPYRKNPNSPYYNIECSFYNDYSKCDLVHQFVKLNATCSIPDVNQGKQWIEIYNKLNYTIRLTNFGVTRISNTVLNIQGAPPEYFGADYKGYETLAMNPHQSCFIGFFGNTGEDLLFPLNNTSVAISYDYNGEHHMAATPFLTDTYNDSRTWQFDGNKWMFANQNTVSIPEFQFATLILLVGITSLVVLYRIRYKRWRFEY